MELPMYIEPEAAKAFMRDALGLPATATDQELHDVMLAIGRDCWEGLLRRAQGMLNG